jgi:hypothetical protein
MAAGAVQLLALPLTALGGTAFYLGLVLYALGFAPLALALFLESAPTPATGRPSAQAVV